MSTGRTARRPRSVVVERDVAIPMRDGTILRANVWRPPSGRHPVLLQRTPYDKDDSFVAHHHSGLEPLRAVDAGFVVVQQDVRGRFASDGAFSPFVDERSDGVDTIDWLAGQPFSNGRIGTYGVSYVGATQLLAASGRPAALGAIAPHETAYDYQTGWIYRAGAFELGFNLLWALALARVDVDRRAARGEDVAELSDRLASLARDPWSAYRQMPLLGGLPELEAACPAWRDWLSRPSADDRWRAISPRDACPGIDVPALHIGGWHDVLLAGALDGFAALRDQAPSERTRANQRLLIGPWAHAVPHETIGHADFGPDASQLAVDMTRLHLEWFTEQLADEPGDEVAADARGRAGGRAPVRIFVMGANRWRDEADWPLARAVDTSYHLAADGRLTLAVPSADDGADSFRYDPADPVPTVGGATFLPGLFVGWHAGPQDVAPLDGRTDILRYRSDPLPRAVEVTGPAWVDLYAMSSARDTDFTARLIDVHPDGRALGVTSGIVRARYRHGQDRATLIEPGAVVRYRIDLAATSMVFGAGHRIRLDISSSDFPRFDRNPNHGRDIATAGPGDLVVATQRVHRDANHPSAIHLPVIPDSRPEGGR